MPVIGIALVWAAYTAGLWGYCLVRGYNITLPQLLSSKWPPVPPNSEPMQPPGNNTPQQPLVPLPGFDPSKPYGGGYRPPGSK